MKSKIFTSLILIFLIFFQLNLFCQSDPQIIWENTIGGTLDDQANASYATSDGGIVIGGYSRSDTSSDKTENSIGFHDFWVIKLDASGNIQWQNTIGGTWPDVLHAIQQTRDGGYILGGTSESDSSGDKNENRKGSDDYWIIKLDSAGTILWQKTIGGSNYQSLQSLSQTVDGGYILGGVSTSNISDDKTENCLGLYDFWVVKIDSVGEIQWQNTIGGAGTDVPLEISQTLDGGYFIGGNSTSSISGDKSEDSIGLGDYWIVKLDAGGNIEWDNTIGGTNSDQLVAAQQTPDGGYILGGHSKSGISGDKTEPNIQGYDYWIVKLDSIGDIQWQNTIGGMGGPGFGEDRLGCLDQTSDGGYIIAGCSISGIGADKTEPNYGTYDYWILKLDPVGNIEWQNTLNSLGTEFPTSVKQLLGGEYIVSGYSSGYSIGGGDKSEAALGSGWMDFWIVKLVDPVRILTGNVYADLNFNCNLDTSSDKGIHDIIISNAFHDQHAITDANGDYSLMLFRDTSIVYLGNLLHEDDIACLPSDTMRIYTSDASAFDTVINFPLQASVFCHHLNISISSVPLRSCSTPRKYSVNYENVSFDTARSAFIIVEIDTSVVEYVVSPYSYTQFGDTLLFYIGDIIPFQRGIIQFSTRIKCNAVLGSSICARAFIYPRNNCTPLSPLYDSSEITVKTSCFSDTITAIIENIATSHDMHHLGTMSVLEDEILMQVDTFLLSGGSSHTYKIFAEADRAITLVVRQDINHPERPVIIRHDELCGLTIPLITHSIVPDFPRYDEADEYEEVCSPIVGSHDPNLKSVSPQGLTAQHFTDATQELEYKIDFQNTGSDTAFKVIVVDTLSRWLDMNSFKPLVASHTYTPVLEGVSTIKFVFDPIALPDSNASEENSHGYVTFKIKPKSNTPKGIIINNYADIYFDMNAPVQTNTIFNMIYDTVLINLGTGMVDVKSLESRVLIFPNPALEKFYVNFNKELDNAKIIITNVAGEKIYELTQLNGSVIEMNADGLSKGIYLINVYEKQKLLAMSKIVIH